MLLEFNNTYTITVYTVDQKTRLLLHFQITSTNITQY